ncbi:MAG: rRNA (uracil1498-N3)-methyltransferase [Candidatus Dependentiae bacterium]|nr:rRNA (uracil1498-N3)-methyltransferase [Candidatus Dependentiae bacterium]
MSQSHTFFLYVGDLLAKHKVIAGSALTIVSKELANRLFTILRLREQERVQLFSDTQVLTLTLTASPRPKDTICAIVQSIEKINAPKKIVIAAIGLLKKESFEEAVHHAAVTGATHIQPLITTKSRKGWMHEREAERLKAVIIAACEQSKNRYIPLLLNPQTLTAACTAWPQACRIGFEAENSKPLSTLIAWVTTTAPLCSQIFIGPEGGFTTEELGTLRTEDVEFYQLTPTILRSQEATCLALGLIGAL